MEVILLEKIRSLGELGDRIKVRPGYGRNFLIPQKKAVPATKHNIAHFEARRAELEALAKERLDAAEKRAETLNGQKIAIEARASEEGKLFGSVGTSEIVEALAAQNLAVTKAEIDLPDGAFRQIGLFPVRLILHTDVSAEIELEILPSA